MKSNTVYSTSDSVGEDLPPARPGNPVTVTATVALWVSEGYSHRELMTAIERGDGVGAVNALSFFGLPSRESFADCIRVGEADVTLRLIPKDDQTRLMVQALQRKLEQERAKWYERQQAILAEISKLQALEYVEAE